MSSKSVIVVALEENCPQTLGVCLWTSKKACCYMNSPILLSTDFLKCHCSSPGPPWVHHKALFWFWNLSTLLGKRKEVKFLPEESQLGTKEICFVKSLSIQASNQENLMGQVTVPSWITVLKRTFRGAWVARSVKRLSSAQVIISLFGSSSPPSGSALTVRSLLGVLSLSLSLCPCPALSLSLKRNK